MGYFDSDAVFFVGVAGGTRALGRCGWGYWGLWLMSEEEQGPQGSEQHPETDVFDVFLSYNRNDRRVVHRLARELEGRGLRVWLDEAQLFPGDRWQEKLGDALGKAQAVAVLIGEGGFGRWHKQEADVALQEECQRRARIIPVLLPGVPKEFRLPRFLQTFTSSDLRSGFDSCSLDNLVRGIKVHDKSFHVECSSSLPTRMPKKAVWGSAASIVALLGLVFAVLALRSSYAVVAGIILDPFSEPIEGVAVALPFHKAHAVTDGGGHFDMRVKGTQGSVTELTAQKEGFEYLREIVRLGDATLRLQMRIESD